MYDRLVRGRPLLVVLAIGATSVAGCGGSSADGPGDFAKQQYEQMSRGERHKVYDSLLPGSA
jgi:hypothetical protein